MFGECTLTSPEREPARGGEGGIRHAPDRPVFRRTNHAAGLNQRAKLSREHVAGPLPSWTQGGMTGAFAE